MVCSQKREEDLSEVELFKNNCFFILNIIAYLHYLQHNNVQELERAFFSIKSFYEWNFNFNSDRNLNKYMGLQKKSKNCYKCSFQIYQRRNFLKIIVSLSSILLLTCIIFNITASGVNPTLRNKMQR